MPRLRGVSFCRSIEGEIGPACTKKRLAVDRAHQRIGLEPEGHIGAFSRLLRIVLRVSGRETGPPEPRIDVAESLIKIFFYDLSLAIDAYIDVAAAASSSKPNPPRKSS